MERLEWRLLATDGTRGSFIIKKGFLSEREVLSNVFCHEGLRLSVWLMMITPENRCKSIIMIIIWTSTGQGSILKAWSIEEGQSWWHTEKCYVKDIEDTCQTCPHMSSAGSCSHIYIPYYHNSLIFILKCNLFYTLIKKLNKKTYEEEFWNKYQP